jgi:hypothetical protein
VRIRLTNWVGNPNAAVLAEKRTKQIGEALGLMGLQEVKYCMEQIIAGGESETMLVTMACMDKLVKMVDANANMEVGAAILEDIRRQDADAAVAARTELVSFEGKNKIGFEFIDAKALENMLAKDRSDYAEERRRLLTEHNY